MRRRGRIWIKRCSYEKGILLQAKEESVSVLIHMKHVIAFNKNGYDPFIDFIKVYAIICVLIGHTLPFRDYWGYGLWAGMQVPLFVLVQVFHCFKKKSPYFNFNKIIYRILIPFFFIQIIILALLVLKNEGQNVPSSIKSFFLFGGGGPGSYYPWVYIQISIILPIVKRLMDKYDKSTNAIVYILICETIEIISSIINLPDSVHRILATRYLFLIYIGWIWVNEGIVINAKNILFSLISFLSIIYFEYFSVDDEIMFYNTTWKFHRWPCYYFVGIGGTALLYYAYMMLSNNKRIERIIKLIAKCSYEIFLIQMLVLPFYPSIKINSILLITGIESHLIIQTLGIITKLLVVSAISIFVGYYFNKYYNISIKHVI